MALTLPACSGGRDFSVVLVFPDEAARVAARQIRIAALVATEESSCQALIAGDAAPGDPGYVIEGEIGFLAGEADRAEPLRRIGPGERLFFAEVADADAAVYLRGCAALLAGGKGPGEVIVTLVAVSDCQPSNGGVETCDGLDNDCDGETDDGDPLYLCPVVPHAVADACSAGVCSFTCQGNWIDANGEVSDGCECLPSRDSEEWCDGLDNDCDGQVDGPDCQACGSDADCEDPDSCLGGTCSAGACQVSYSADGTACDDGSVCTTADACLEGICLGQQVECDDGNACTTDLCDPLSGCGHDFNTAGCDDGDGCTTGDVCDGAGQCRGQPIRCDQPPADECLGQDTVRHYSVPGNCQPADGQCLYEQQDEACADGCIDGACRSSACQDQAEGTTCDDGSVCTLTDRCDANGVCRGNPLDCSDSNPCTDDSCNPQTGCVNAPNSNPCDDGDACTVGDVCADRTCQGQPRDCSDGLDCTLDSCSDGDCAHEIAADRCLIDAACWIDGESPPDSSCRLCMPNLAQEQWAVAFGADCSDALFCNGTEHCGVTGNCGSSGNPCGDTCMQTCLEISESCAPDPAGSPCDDGLACTEDTCDGEGACVSVADDGLCGAGEICLPQCALDASGCVPVPQLTVACPDGPVSGGTTCTVSLGGVAGQLACLQCAALIGAETLDSSDFTLDGQAGVCDLDGWTIDDGPCRTPVQDPQCPFRPGTVGCCQTYSCPASEAPWAGREALQFDGGSCLPEQWRMFKQFPMQGFAEAQTCFDFVWTGGSTDGAFQMQVDNGNQAQGIDVIECMQDTMYPQREVVRRCYDLPLAWLAVPLTRVLLWFDVNGLGGSWLVDNLAVRAWWPECPAYGGTRFLEDFSTCSGDLPADYNGWTVSTVGQVNCNDEPCSDSMVRIGQGDQLIMSRTVDTRGAAAPLELCWLMGGKATGEAYLEIDYDLGAGSQLAYYYYGPPTGDDDLCSEHCIDLSAIDGNMIDNPALGLTIQVFPFNERVILDDIRLRGAARCDAASAGLLDVSALSAVGVDTFQIDLSNLDGRPFSVNLECTWAQGQGAVTSADTFQFGGP